MNINSTPYNNYQNKYALIKKQNVTSIPQFKSRQITIKNAFKPKGFIPEFEELNLIERIKFELFEKQKLKKKIISTACEMQKNGIANPTIKEIFEKIKNFKLKSPALMIELIDTLTTNIPENTENKKDFIIKRFKASTQHIYLGKFDKNFFKLTTKLHNAQQNLSWENINELVLYSNDILNTKVQKDAYGFIKNCINKYDIETTKKLLEISFLTQTKINVMNEFINFDFEDPIEEIKGFQTDNRNEIWSYLDKLLPVFNKLYKNNPQLGAKYIKSILLQCVSKIENKINENDLEYAEKNIKEPYLLEILKYARINDKLDEIIILQIKKLLLNGWKVEDLDPNQYGSHYFPDYRFLKRKTEQENYINTLIEYGKKYNGKKKNLLNIINRLQNISPEDYEKNTEKILNIRSEAIKNFKAPDNNENVKTSKIDKVLFADPWATILTNKLLGDNVFKYLISKGIDNLSEKIDFFADYNERKKEYSNKFWSKDLILSINPTESEEYKNLISNINELKNKFNTVENEEKAELITKINTYTKLKNDLIKNSISDPEEALKVAIIYKAIYDSKNLEHLETLKKYLKNLNNQEASERNIFLNKILLDIYEYNDTISSECIDRINLSNSKYLPQFFDVDTDFIENFTTLIEIINSVLKNNDNNITNLEIFNTLSNNKKTKELFEKYKINYDKYTKFNPESKIEFKIKTSYEKEKNNIIQNIEKDFNDELYSIIPETEKNIFLFKLKENQYDLVKTKIINHNTNGFITVPQEKFKFLKNGKPLNSLKDAEAIISIFREMISERPFWIEKNSNTMLNNAKNTIKNHLLVLRYNEIKNAHNLKKEKDINITIQKADMNDIPHALNLGGDSSCCTAVNGINSWTAPNYIINKFISAIEIKDGDKYIGNTMCYFAIVDKKISLILDNIEMKSEYQYNDKIRDGIIEYAKKLTEEVGKPNIPIYAGPNRHKITTDGFEMKKTNMQIIGSTGDDFPIYLDFDADSHIITENNNTIPRVKLYKLN